jgi:hypothetical protein
LWYTATVPVVKALRHPASESDKIGRKALLQWVCGTLSGPRLIWATASIMALGVRGRGLGPAAETAERPSGQLGFRALRLRGIAEQTIAWGGSSWRLAKGYGISLPQPKCSSTSLPPDCCSRRVATLVSTWTLHFPAPGLPVVPGLPGRHRASPRFGWLPRPPQATTPGPRRRTAVPRGVLSVLSWRTAPKATRD